MEDRNTPALYVVLSDDPPVDEVRALAGVDAVTVWENLRPGRTEMPMRVPEGTRLMVAEVSPSFVAPAVPAGTTAFHFVRYPRPSQGCLTGRPTTGLLVVWISPKRPELAQPLRDWADFCHLRHIAAAGVPGYTTITPYENVSGGDPRFMHFYEMDTDDPEGAYQLMPKLVIGRLGGAATPEFAEWADLSRAGGYAVYVNTFRRV